MTVVTDLAVGTAAEHLVCVDLLMAGYNVFLTDQNCAYDIVCDHNGRLIRIQVKSTREQRSIPQRANHIPSYMWHVRRSGRGGRRVYGDTEFDILALVALDIREVAYMPPVMHRQTIHIRPPGATNGKQFADYPFNKALEEIAR